MTRLHHFAFEFCCAAHMRLDRAIMRGLEIFQLSYANRPQRRMSAAMVPRERPPQPPTPKFTLSRDLQSEVHAHVRNGGHTDATHAT